jgi:DNA-binding transcriptional ArsR family regulator
MREYDRRFRPDVKSLLRASCRRGGCAITTLTRRRLSTIFNQMVKYYDPALDLTFSALGDSTRRAILARLALGDASVGELAAPFEMSLPAVSKHLKVLERAGLLARDRQGRVHRCRLDPEPMRRAEDWIGLHRRFWEERFDALNRYLQDLKHGEDDDGTSNPDERA